MPEITQEFVSAALATMELRLVREMASVEERTRTNIEKLKVEMAANPETFAGLKANVADLKDDVDQLQQSDKRWAGLTMLVSAAIAGIGSWLVGGRK